MDVSKMGLAATLIALVPILWLFISLGFMKVSSYKACLTGLVLSLIIAVAIWQMPWLMAVKAGLEGTCLALMPILWVILAAFFTFNISLHTGAMERIKNLMASLSQDRRIQVLIIAWGFGSFLEAAAGFGTAVAIPASILIALGFEPFRVVIVCLLANTIAVAFGVIGIPLTTLAKITGLPAMTLSLDVVMQLTPFVLLIPFLMILTLTRSMSGFRGVGLITFVAGFSFGISQFFVAKFAGPELPALVASLVSCGAIILCAKLLPPKQQWLFPGEQEKTVGSESFGLGDVRQQLVSWAPYVLLLILVLGTSKLFPAVSQQLGKVKSEFLIYDGLGGKPFYIEWLLTPGTLIMISAICGGLLQGASVRKLGSIFAATIWQFRKTFVTVIAIVSMAKVLSYSGMVGNIAAMLAAVTGRAYPFFAPMIGALGTFLTGSDTSSNVLFGALQKETAIRLGADQAWIAAANTSGACAGKMISPQSITIAASAAGLAGKEGEFLNVTFKYVVVFVIGLGIVTYLFA